MLYLLDERIIIIYKSNCINILKQRTKNQYLIYSIWTFCFKNNYKLFQWTHFIYWFVLNLGKNSQRVYMHIVHDNISVWWHFHWRRLDDHLEVITLMKLTIYEPKFGQDSILLQKIWCNIRKWHPRGNTYLSLSLFALAHHHCFHFQSAEWSYKQ